jgi:hypothetical protein
MVIYFDSRVRLIDVVAFPLNVMVRTYGFLLMMVMTYGENCYLILSFARLIRGSTMDIRMRQKE